MSIVVETKAQTRRWMQLARRIRGDRRYDFVDRQPKDGSEVFQRLPDNFGKRK